LLLVARLGAGGRVLGVVGFCWKRLRCSVSSVSRTRGWSIVAPAQAESGSSAAMPTQMINWLIRSSTSRPLRRTATIVVATATAVSVTKAAR
jgi:hypothetical protein